MNINPPDDNTEKDLIHLVKYNPAWPQLAEAEIQILRNQLPYSWIVDFQHVGSTAIPGIAAKPIIDIYIGVTSLSLAEQNAIKPIEALGYQFWDQRPEHPKLFFVKGMPPFGEGRTHHVHIVEYKSDYWTATILFRDYLRNHPEEVICYEQLKCRLMAEHRYDREAYTNGKNDYVANVLRKAGFAKDVRR